MFHLDNSEVVRLKKNGLRFEVACYKNKVALWRNGLLSDLNEVLQSTAVFVNVSKGQTAKIEELVKAFGIEDQTKISIEILNNGELLMSDKDRHAHHENILKEVTSMVATKCLNPKTKQSYHVDVIKQSMKDLNFSVDPNKSVKQQGLELIKQLQASGKLPIERAEIKMKLSFPVKGEKEGKKIKDKLSKITKRIDSEEYWNADTLEIVCTVDPGHLKEVESLINSETKGHVLYEVQSFKVEE